MTQDQNWHQGYDILAIKTEKIMYSKGTPICMYVHTYFAESVYKKFRQTTDSVEKPNIF